MNNRFESLRKMSILFLLFTLYMVYTVSNEIFLLLATHTKKDWLHFFLALVHLCFFLLFSSHTSFQTNAIHFVFVSWRKWHFTLHFFFVCPANERVAPTCTCSTRIKNKSENENAFSMKSYFLFVLWFSLRRKKMSRLQKCHILQRNDEYFNRIFFDQNR